MASLFGHAISSLAFTSCFSIEKSEWTKIALLGIFCAVVPDADILAFRFGIPYLHPFGHRGFTHSLFFALLLALFIRWTFFMSVKWNTRKGWILFTLFFLCTASHGVLDAMTTGGRGIAFFGPFNNARYFLPWRVIQVSPLSASRFFSDWGWRVIKSEAIWIGIPSLLLILVNLIRKKLRSPKHS